jgi:O-antigen/teichoic acid export membrane protein
MLGLNVWRERRSRIGPLFRRAAMVEQAKKYSDFPFFSAPTSLLDVLALQLPVLLLTKSSGPSVVGLFALSTRVIGVPLSLVGTCVGQVYYQWVADSERTDANLRPYALKVAGYLGLMAAGPVLLAVVFAPVVFSIVFGNQWRTAGDYARILVFPLAARFIVSPLAVIMPASGNVRLNSAWKIIYFCSSAIVLYFASLSGPTAFLWIYCVLEMFLWGIYFVLILRVSGAARLSDEENGIHERP